MRKPLLVLFSVLPSLLLAQGPKGKVVVEVRHNDRPVTTASVTLEDGTRKQDALVDASSKGDATFSDVQPGALKVVVRYRAAGKDAAPVTQIFQTKGGDGTPHLAIAVPEAAETLGDRAAAAPSTASPVPPISTAVPAPTPAPSGGFNFVGALTGLLVAGGVAGGAWYLLKKHPEAVGGTLEKLGAQIPKPGDAPLADPPVPAAPAPAAPEPPQKIVLDPIASPIAVVAPIAMDTGLGIRMGEPTLVSEMGVPIPLPEGETTVGREIGLGLSLAGETTVSRRHARLVRTGDSVTLEDEGSTNGTFVNGAPAAGSVALRPGDAVQFGSVKFRYEG